MTGALAETLVGFHVALAFVLLVRQPVARYCGAGWAYAFWILPLARIVVPPHYVLPPASAPSSLAYLAPQIGEVAAPLPSTDSSEQWMPLLLALWAMGAALFILWQCIAYWRLARAVTRSGRSRSPFGRWRVVETQALSVPVAMGFFGRRIVLPADFDHRFTPAERALALEHEAVHLGRGDLWWNMAALTLLALNWFSPLAHWAFRAFRADQELACDAVVAARAGAAGRYAYAAALVKSASQPGLIAACPLNHAAQLKRRLKMMQTHGGGRVRAIGGGLAAAGFLVLGLGLSSANAAQESPQPESRPETRAEIVSIERQANASEADVAEPKVERNVRIVTVGKGAPKRDIRVRGEEVEIDGKTHADLAAACAAGDGSAVSVNEEGAGTTTRFRICSTSGQPLSQEKRAEMLDKLEGLKQRIAGHDLSEEARSDVSVVLERAIARIRDAP